MLNLGCGQYLRNPFFPGFWGQKWGCWFCILADYTRLYTVDDLDCTNNSIKSGSSPCELLKLLFRLRHLPDGVL